MTRCLYPSLPFWKRMKLKYCVTQNKKNVKQNAYIICMLYIETSDNNTYDFGRASVISPMMYRTSTCCQTTHIPLFNNRASLNRQFKNIYNKLQSSLNEKNISAHVKRKNYMLSIIMWNRVYLMFLVSFKIQFIGQ